MTSLWIEPFGGFAGDMFLAALLDLGDPRFQLEDLTQMAHALVPGECELQLDNVMRGAFAGRLLSVTTDESVHPPHRHLSDLQRLLDGCAHVAPIRDQALRVLVRLAEAEGKVHGIAPEEVHFHEVGAVDTLVDICGALLALHRLQVTQVFSRPPITGEGHVKCAHGEMPVPVPAVVELFRGLPLEISGGPGERLTPTGAALLAEVVDQFVAPGAFVCERVGLGAGKREPRTGPANLVRVQLAASGGAGRSRTRVWCMEVHLDDCTGEEIGWCLEGLRSAETLDVWCTALQMKKNRPGVLLSALCKDGQRESLEAVVFERTPSLGLRWFEVERTECERRIERIEIEGLSVRVKLRQRPEYSGRSPFGPRDISPEYDDLRELAEQQNWSLRQAEEQVVTQFLKGNSSYN